MTAPIAHVEVDRYVISCLPVDHPEWARYSLFAVFRRNLGGWVVTDGVVNLDADGRRHYASVASAADRAKYTFPSEVEALAVARQLAAVMAPNGKPVADVLREMAGDAS
ncbi:hypothetical protein [Nocardia aurea]|uniref:hypothetical protein n=1 Tax=Nocardia aurea TaxID=2144174 RepID=UPI0033AB5CFF